ncbi:MAG TPA: glycoside hydrolase family 6 protein [Streptosporangiaceae bacterium]|nr:glycoside hydrolase family 6 protein [Streptosporangiaceae bacterium]
MVFVKLRRLRRYFVLLAAAVLGITGLGAAAIAGSPPAAAATGCSVAYSIQSQWSTGFVVSITITNLGSPITSWNLGYSYSGNQQVTNGWNGTWSQSGENVTVTNASYNGSVATNGTVNFGAQFSYSGTNTNPTAFTVNGTQCTGQTTSPGNIVVNPTSQNIAQNGSGTVAVSLSAAPTANVTVTTAETSGNSGLSVSSGGSLTFTPSNFSTVQNVKIAADSSGSGMATFTVSATGYTSVTFTVNETTSGGTPSLSVTPTAQNITQGSTGTVGVSLSSAPSANVTVTVARTSGNTGLSVTAGSSLTFTPTNFGTAQSVTVTADGSSTGAATFTVSAPGLTSVSFTATEAVGCTGNCGHVADPFSGAKPYLNPDYVKEVQAQASSDGSSAEAAVANSETAIWLDTMASINGGTTATGTRTGLMQQLTNAAAAGTAATPSLVEIVVYDLPGRDCAALASNGEIPATTAGLTEYESQYIDPIASILTQFASSNIRVVAIIEPDSLPNVVTNQSKSACQTATPFYEQGITYALNKLHAISNVYNYMDIAHSAWLGWPNNMSGTPAVYNSVVQATTAKYASIDGFISDTANYTPTQEPLLTNPTLQINGQNVDSATFYQFNPTFDELTYDTQMYNTLVSAGFPASKKFLIDTSRNGWGATHPTTITQASDVNTYVADNKIDKRPFRGDWCNQNNAGIGARPADQPFGASSPILAFVWIKPPGESDGDYPTSTHTHGDPHCDPNGTNTDGNGGTYSTGSIPGFDVPAGQWFPAEFQMLVKNAFPGF